MAESLILLHEKPQAQPKIKASFFGIVDGYITSQGMQLVCEFPRIYISKKNVTPTKLKQLITTVKNTNDYNKVIKDVYYSTSLQKG